MKFWDRLILYLLNNSEDTASKLAASMVMESFLVGIKNGFHDLIELFFG